MSKFYSTVQTKSRYKGAESSFGAIISFTDAYSSCFRREQEQGSINWGQVRVLMDDGHRRSDDKRVGCWGYINCLFPRINPISYWYQELYPGTTLRSPIYRILLAHFKNSQLRFPGTRTGTTPWQLRAGHLAIVSKILSFYAQRTNSNLA